MATPTNVVFEEKKSGADIFEGCVGAVRKYMWAQTKKTISFSAIISHI